MHEEYMYKCSAATSGTWDDTKWRQIQVADLIKPDEKTIVYNSDNRFETAIGGWKEAAGTQYWVAGCDPVEPPISSTVYQYSTTGYIADIPSTCFKNTIDLEISGTMGGTDVSGTYTFTETISGSKIYVRSNTTPESTWTFDLNPDTSGSGCGKVIFTFPDTSVIQTGGNIDLNAYYYTDEDFYHTIDGRYIPVDDDTIKIDPTTHELYADIDAVSLEAIADAYDATSGVYAVDDVVIYNQKLYRCKTAITTGEEFDTDKWYEISVDNGMYLHDKVVGTTSGYKHTLSLAGETGDPHDYTLAFNFTNAVSTSYTTLNDLALALIAAGHGESGTKLAATGTVNGNTIALINAFTGTSESTIQLFDASEGSLGKVGTATTLTDTVTSVAATTLHPSAPEVDFSNSTSFPALSDVKTYVDANPNQIVTMKSVYSMIMRFFGRSYVGTTFSASTALGDKLNATTSSLEMADDCSLEPVTGEPGAVTLVVPT